jgi:hypothetical protein
MYHSRIDVEAATPAGRDAVPPSGLRDRVLAALIVLGLPLLLLGALAHFVARDVVRIARGLRAVHRTYAEEFARRR